MSELIYVFEKDLVHCDLTGMSLQKAVEQTEFLKQGGIGGILICSHCDAVTAKIIVSQTGMDIKIIALPPKKENSGIFQSDGWAFITPLRSFYSEGA